MNNHAHILKPIRGNLEYLAALMEVVDYRPWITGAAQPKLTQERLMSIQIPVPPVTEQTQISNWVAQETSWLTAEISKTKRAIELFKEFQSRLVSGVVTGEFDVRTVTLSTVDLVEDLPAIGNEETEDNDSAQVEESAVADQ